MKKLNASVAMICCVGILLSGCSSNHASRPVSPVSTKTKVQKTATVPSAAKTPSSLPVPSQVAEQSLNSKTIPKEGLATAIPQQAYFLKVEFVDKNKKMSG